MELILWRHAEAEDGFPDMARRLTAKGEKQAEKMAVFLRSHLPQNIRILVSPAKRAQQTAQALTKNFTTEPAIAPEASPKVILEKSGWYGGEGCVLVVGHQPALGEVAALLLTGKPEYWSIKKGAIWWFVRRGDEENSDIALRLVITPDLL